MGFSVSGSTAVIFLGIVISVGIVLSAAQTTGSELSNSWNQRTSDMLGQKNTYINVTDAKYNKTLSKVTVNATNMGSTTLSIDKLNLLVDGNLKPDRGVQVVGARKSSLWLPGEKISFTGNSTGMVESVEVVTGNGVSRVKEVDG
ncbi:fla cluster protein FlaF [Haladaptatus sp. F3-133]|uniref:Fla cluster protein FlaF n=1 Tax=Halorutilus salinus TaxID=2487751 RepID=A0A9Q4C3K3_9EURY|nr:fla cluster protein FlaF [Halorutilus salinus]MCX2818426.1 fla cluster protein FlaF [Halorutilus salinus]